MIGIANLVYPVEQKVEGTFAFGNSYPTGGEDLYPRYLGLSRILRVKIQNTDGYDFEIDILENGQRVKIKVVDVNASVLAGDADPASGGTPAGTISTPTFTATGGTYIPMVYEDIKGAIGDPNENVDGAEAVNASYVAAYSTVAAGAWTAAAITQQPDVTRSILISVKNDSGGPLNLFQGNMTWTIQGTDELGNAITGTAIINSTAGNKAIANGQFRSTACTAAMKTVTSVTLNNVPDNGLKISVGLGSSFKILNGLKTPSSSDVIRVSLNATNQVNITDYFVNTVGVTQPTITYKNGIADGDDISLTYLTSSGATGTISTPTFAGVALSNHDHTISLSGSGSMAEVANGTDLSSLNAVAFEAYGY